MNATFPRICSQLALDKYDMFMFAYIEIVFFKVLEFAYRPRFAPMSGFEIAGVVLGALPILFKAVDFSKDGFSRVGLAFHKRKNVQKLANALLLQQGILEAIVKSILHESGCEDIWRLEQDPYNYLTDKSVQEEVLDFLGAKNDAAFTGALEQCLEIVKKIAKNITGLVPTYKVRLDTSCLTCIVPHGGKG